MATANLSVESKDFTLPVVEATAGADGIRIIRAAMSTISCACALRCRTSRSIPTRCTCMRSDAC